MGPMSLLIRGARKFARSGGPVLAGVVAICVIIYIAGPRMGLNSTALRLYIIGGIIGVVLLGFLVRWLWVRWRGKQLQSDMASQQDPKAAEREAEIQALREKMDEAVAALKTSELGGGHRGAAALYALPWYMIIGPSAAGKSTLLCNSGLHFPYANSEDLHLRGFGGTRNCDWWFSDQAVILDTAGRYTTEEDDREEWFSFLQLVRRHRKRVPLNGVIVAISVSDLLTADSAALERHVKIIRERIDEVTRELGMVVPVYLVFTKCDLIKGFDAYFGDLSEADRGQVWGAYLLDGDEDDAHAVDERFTGHMESLYGRLCELRLHKLSRERNLARKAELYDFPAQFLAASETLGEFVRLLFRSNPYQETPMLAGVYLTSSTQEGTPLQRALGGLRQAFGLARDDDGERSGEKRAFFIQRLFTDVIFQLPGAVRSNRRRMLWGRWLKGVAVAGALGVLTLSLVVLSTSYGHNALLLTEGEDRVEAVGEAVSSRDDDGLARYAELEALFEYYERLQGYEKDLPWTLRFGMYTGDELISGVEKVLFRALGQEFRDPVLTDLEYRLDNLAREWDKAEPEVQEAMRSDYYDALRSYLVTARFTERMDVDRTTPLMADLWAQRLGLAAEDEGYGDVGKRAPYLDGLVRFYLERAGEEKSLRKWPVRPQLVKQARVQLVTPPNAERLYARIRHRGIGKLGSYTIDDLLSADNRDLMTGGQRLEVFYSADGWYDFARDAIETVIAAVSDRDWVLTAALADSGEPVAVPESVDATEVSDELAAKLQSRIRDLYFEDYAAHWFGFLGAVRPTEYGSLKSAVGRLNRFARSDGPIGELMQVTARNINLHERRAPGGEAAEQANQLRPRVEELEASFAELRRFANPAENKSTSNLIHQYLLLLGDLKGATQRLAASADLTRDAESYAARVLSGSGSDTELYRTWVSMQSLLNGAGARTEEALKPLLSQPISELWRSVIKLARLHIESRWRAQVKAAYGTNLQDKFPFASGGPDANLDEVSAFFRPSGGVLWSFVDRELGPYLKRTRSGWRGRSWLGVELGFSDNFLYGLRKAKTITDALFREGARQPSIVFYLYPLPAGGASAITLESNGQTYRYRNGPQEWRRFEWPGDMERIGARVAATISRGNARAERKAERLWGLFHLLRDADITTRDANHIKVEWQVQAGSRSPVPVRFMFRADGNAHVFNGSLMGNFALPSRLFPESAKADQQVAEVN